MPAPRLPVEIQYYVQVCALVLAHWVLLHGDAFCVSYVSCACDACVLNLAHSPWPRVSSNGRDVWKLVMHSEVVPDGLMVREGVGVRMRLPDGLMVREGGVWRTRLPDGLMVREGVAVRTRLPDGLMVREGGVWRTS